MQGQAGEHPAPYVSIGTNGDFERVLGSFWEAEILDFRTFFDVFSKHFSNIFLEGQKIEKKSPTRQKMHHLGSGLRNARPPGERKREGGRSLKMKKLWEAGWI